MGVVKDLREQIAADPSLLWITIDSGNPMGYALWRGGLLMLAGACDFSEWLKSAGRNQAGLAIFELPDHHAKGAVSDITLCAARGGMAAAHASACPAPMAVHDWKGQYHKRVTLERSEAALSPHEKKQIYSGASHCWDAIGMGLFLLKRIQR